MRGAGQIAELTAIAEPEVGVIVNVGPVHLELLGSLEAIAAAKAELIAGMTSGATAIVPAGEPLLGEHLRADSHTVTFGPGWRRGAHRSRTRRSVGIMDGAVRAIVLRPSFAQSHNLGNLLAAVAAARALGVTPGGEVTCGSPRCAASARLSEGIVLVDDCYNANPMSMRSALDDLAQPLPVGVWRCSATCSSLAPTSIAFTVRSAPMRRARGDVLVTVGPLAAEMARAAPSGRPAGRGPVPRPRVPAPTPLQSSPQRAPARAATRCS